MLSRAIALVSDAFQGEYDKGGQPYILHCLAVMERVKHLGTDAMCVAVMHDLIEDTEYTHEKLMDMGFSETVCDMVQILSMVDETYDEFIDRIIASGNRAVMKIKMADLRHNSDIHRMKGLRNADFERLKKYHRAYSKIRTELEKSYE